MKKNLSKFVGLGCLLAATSLTSCNPSGTTIGVTWYNYADANMSTYWKPAFEESAKEKGWSLNAQDLENKSEKLLTTVDNFIAQQVAGLAINLVNPTQGKEVVKKAKEADIPLVIWNKEPTLDGSGTVDNVSLPGFEFGYFVGTEAKQAGEMQARQYVEFMKKNPTTWDKNNDGKIKPYVLLGEKGHVEADARTRYCIEELKNILGTPGHGVKNSSGKELTKEDVIFDEGQQVLECKDSTNGATWDGKSALNYWNNKIKNDRATDVIFSNNDDMAVSMIEDPSFPNKNNPVSKDGVASKEHMPIFGIDCSTNGISAVKEGTLTASVKNDSTKQAKVAFDVLEAMINVKTSTEKLDVKTEVNKVLEKWKENGVKYQEELKAFRVDYTSVTIQNIEEIFPGK